MGVTMPSRGRITIPKKIRDSFHWNEKANVTIEGISDGVFIFLE